MRTISQTCISTLVLFCFGLQAQMINPGFELTAPGSYTSANAVAGWTVESRTANSACTFTNWTPGSPELTVRTTPFTNYPFPGAPHGIINHSPLGGNNILQIGDTATNQKMTRIRQTFPVTFSNTLLQIAHAGYWEDGGGNHGCCQQSGVTFNIYDCAGNRQPCVFGQTVIPSCASPGFTFSVNSSGHYWYNWKISNIDLSMFEGSCVTLEIITTDCAFGCHFGTSLLDFATGSAFMAIPNSTTLYLPPPSSAYCPNSNYVQLIAPPGYMYYQWYGPTGPITLPQGTMQVLNWFSLQHSTYTLITTTANNCQASTIYTISPTQVDIGGLAVNGSCPGGSAGAATVFAVGSPAGYTYTWTNTSGSIVSTASVATSLAPGNYTLTVAGSTLVPCGSATTVVTIPAALPKVTHVSRTYCSQAYLSAPSGGTNFKWYYNNALLPGLTQSSYTVTTPCNACTYTVAYDNVNGCRDSVAIHTFSIAPALWIVPTSTRAACFSQNNGSLTIGAVASGPVNLSNSWLQISSIGSTTPLSYSYSPLTVGLNTIQNLYAGTYSITAFDGTCLYSHPVTIAREAPVLKLPAQLTVCGGSTALVSPNFTLTGHSSLYGYTWTPSTYLHAPPGWSPARTILPAIPPGSTSTITYSLSLSNMVTPCPVSATINVTLINPVQPTVNPVPAMCSNAALYTVQAQPPGGTFDTYWPTGYIDSLTGVINPGQAPLGNSTFSYSIHQGICKSSQQLALKISKFHSAQLNADTADLCSNVHAVNLLAYCQNSLNGSWSGPFIQHPVFSPSASQTGIYKTYFKTSSAPDPTLCPDSSTLMIRVTDAPIVSLTSATACAEQPYYLIASGAPSFSYSSGSAIILPTAIQTYSVWGISNYGCKSDSAAVATITAIPSPTVAILASDTVVCFGEALTLTAIGTGNYKWINGPASSTWTFVPLIPQTYTVESTEYGCTSSATFTLLQVEHCTGLEVHAIQHVRVFPNPFNASLNIYAPEMAISAGLYDVSGRRIRKLHISQSANTLDTSQLSAGIYFLKVEMNRKTRTILLVKEL